MPRDILVEPEAGQRVIVNPRNDIKIANASVGKTKLTATVTVSGTYVEPPTDPPPTPVPVPPTSNVVNVSTIPTLLTALADNTVDEIVVANGTYHVSAASGQASDSLWIGSRFAGRTRPIIVRAQTSGSVIFDGGSAIAGGLSFNGGAHDQRWTGFKFNNFKPQSTGVIVFGGYGLPAAHHISITELTMMSGIVGVTSIQDHCMYFSSDGCHDILIEDYTATPGTGIQSALQFNHDPNVYNLIVRRMHVTGTQSTILLYAPSLHDVLIEDSDITGARDNALNVYQCGANVTLRNVNSTSSHGVAYVPGGSHAGLLLVNCSLA